MYLELVTTPIKQPFSEQATEEDMRTAANISLKR